MKSKIKLGLRSFPNSDGLYPLVADYVNEEGKRKRKNVPDVFLEKNQWNTHYQGVELNHPEHLVLNNRITTFTRGLITEGEYEDAFHEGGLTVLQWLTEGLQMCQRTRSKNGLKPLRTVYNKVLEDDKFASCPLIELTDKDVFKHFSRVLERSNFSDLGKNHIKRLRELFNASSNATNTLNADLISSLFRLLPKSFPKKKIKFIPERSVVREWFDLLLAGEREYLPNSGGRAMSLYLFSFINAGIRTGDMFKLKPSNLSVLETDEGYPTIVVKYTMSKTEKNIVMEFDAYDGRELSFSVVFAFLIRYDRCLGEMVHTIAPDAYKLLKRHITRLELKKQSGIDMTGEIQVLQKLVIDIIVSFGEHEKQLENEYLFLDSINQVDSKLAILNASLKFFDERLTSYSARHLYAIMLRENSEDIYMIKERLGHANVKYTEVYLEGLKTKPFEPIRILKL